MQKRTYRKRPMGIDKISTKTLRQKVFDQLKDSIMSAEMEPGQILNLRGLAEKLGVSMMPVREALWQLESEKIIVIESNKRMYIKVLTADEIQEIFKIRLHHEAILLETSCRNFSENLGNKLDRIINKMRQTGQNKKSRFFYWNKEFHFSLYENAEMPVTLSIVENLWLRLAPYFSIHGDDLPIFTDLEPHIEMIEGFKTSNTQQCVTGLKRDINEAQEHILSFYK